VIIFKETNEKYIFAPQTVMGDVMLDRICIEINFCTSKSDGRCVFGGDLYRNKFVHLSDG